MFDVAAVQRHAVSDGDFIFKNCWLLARTCMQHAVVLHVRAIANTDVEHIAAHDRAEPNGRLLANVHVANDLRAVSYESGFVNLRMNTAKRSDHDSLPPDQKLSLQKFKRRSKCILKQMKQKSSAFGVSTQVDGD